jgi:hypothetical protein
MTQINDTCIFCNGTKEEGHFEDCPEITQK